jgi:APA family basic amino acid/polyamine antiporter
MTERDQGHLLRVLGMAFGIAAVIGGTIGQGVLRAPGVVATGVQDGSIILLLWVVVGLISAVDAMSTVELAASIRKTGGPYAFARRAFGRFVGLATGIADWLSYAAVAAFMGVIFGEYLHRLGIAAEVPVSLLAIALLLVIGGIQALGTRIGGASQEVGSAVKALMFIALIVALFMAPRGAPVETVQATPGLTLLGLILALRAIAGTYTGWNAAAYYGEEVRDPGKTIVRATFTGIGVVTVIYVLINAAYLSVLTPAEMAGSNLVAADAAARVFGPAADKIVTAVSLISLVTILNMILMTYPRLLFAIARDAGIPGLSRVSANGSPQIALAFMVTASSLLALVGAYEILLAFATGLTVFAAISVNLAALWMRRKEPDLERPWRMPLFPLPALFSLLVNGALLAAFAYEAPATTAKAFAGLAVLTAITYAITRKRAPVEG